MAYEDHYGIISFVRWHSKHFSRRENPFHVLSHGFSGDSPAKTILHTHGRWMVFLFSVKLYSSVQRDRHFEPSRYKSNEWFVQLHCAIFHVLPSHLSVRNVHYIGLRMDFRECDLYDALPIHFLVWISGRKLDRRTVFHQCEFDDAQSIRKFFWTSRHNQDRQTAFHRSEFYDDDWNRHFH